MKTLKNIFIVCSILIICILVASIYITPLYGPKRIESVTYNYLDDDDEEDDFSPYDEMATQNDIADNPDDANSNYDDNSYDDDNDNQEKNRRL